MVKKRYIALAALILLAASCGGRQGRKNADGASADSLATAEAVPAEAPKPAAPDTVASNRLRGQLPEEPVFDIVTTMGTIRVKLYKDTPKHRDNFTKLALSHYYDGVQFHRIVDGFIIQGGDPYTRDTSRVEEWGEGGPGYNIDAEIIPEHTHKKGALAAARRGDLANPKKESHGSQFYLVQNADACKHLDGEYTVFGETVGGLGVIDRIARISADRKGKPSFPIFINQIKPNEELNNRALQEEQLAREQALKPAEPEQNTEESQQKSGSSEKSDGPASQNPENR